MMKKMIIFAIIALAFAMEHHSGFECFSLDADSLDGIKIFAIEEKIHLRRRKMLNIEETTKKLKPRENVKVYERRKKNSFLKGLFQFVFNSKKKNIPDKIPQQIEIRPRPEIFYEKSKVKINEILLDNQKDAKCLVQLVECLSHIIDIKCLSLDCKSIRTSLFFQVNQKINELIPNLKEFNVGFSGSNMKRGNIKISRFLKLESVSFIDRSLFSAKNTFSFLTSLKYSKIKRLSIVGYTGYTFFPLISALASRFRDLEHLEIADKKYYLYPDCIFPFSSLKKLFIAIRKKEMFELKLEFRPFALHLVKNNSKVDVDVKYVKVLHSVLLLFTYFYIYDSSFLTFNLYIKQRDVFSLLELIHSFLSSSEKSLSNLNLYFYSNPCFRILQTLEQTASVALNEDLTFNVYPTDNKLFYFNPSHGELADFRAILTRLQAIGCQVSLKS